METECHCLCVDKQLICIRLLFLDLKHLFLAQTSLFGLQALLGGASILLSLLVLFLLEFVFLGLVCHADRDWFKFSLVGLLDLFGCHLCELGVFLGGILTHQLRSQGSKWQLNKCLVVVWSVLILDKLNVELSELFLLEVLELSVVLGEHGVLNLSEVAELSSEGSFRLQGHVVFHDVALLAVSLLVPFLLLLAVVHLVSVLKQQHTFVTVLKNFINSLPTQRG